MMVKVFGEPSPAAKLSLPTAVLKSQRDEAMVLPGVGATILVVVGLLIVDRNVPDPDKSAAGVVR